MGSDLISRVSTNRSSLVNTAEKQAKYGTLKVSALVSAARAEAEGLKTPPRLTRNSAMSKSVRPEEKLAIVAKRTGDTSPAFSGSKTRSQMKSPGGSSGSGSTNFRMKK